MTEAQMTEAQPIRDCLPAVVPAGTAEPVSSAPPTSMADFAGIDFDRLPARLDDAQLVAVETMARLPLPAVEPVADKFFAACMRSLATMPSRAGDEDTEKLRYKLYHRKLSEFSEAALGYLVSQALERHTFFPSIAECMAILREFPEHAFAQRQKRRASRRAFDERQARMEDTMEALRRGKLSFEDIAALPEGVRRIAEARGFLRFESDGSYTPTPDTAFIAWLAQQGFAP